MRVPSCARRLGSAAALIAFVPAVGSATTLERRGVEQLAAASEIVVVGQIVDLHAYWNADRSFILTDARVRPAQVLKGAAGEELRFTLPGGTVGDRTALVIGGAELVPGSNCVLFLGTADLPGAPGRLTVRDHAQGAFDVAQGRAISQAVRFGLAPDAGGEASPPGGAAGIAIEDLARIVRDHADRR